MSHEYLPRVIPPQFQVGEAETLCDSHTHENYRVLNRQRRCPTRSSALCGVSISARVSRFELTVTNGSDGWILWCFAAIRFSGIVGHRGTN